MENTIKTKRQELVEAFNNKVTKRDANILLEKYTAELQLALYDALNILTCSKFSITIVKRFSDIFENIREQYGDEITNRLYDFLKNPIRESDFKNE